MVFDSSVVILDDSLNPQVNYYTSQTWTKNASLVEIPFLKSPPFGVINSQLAGGQFVWSW